jgi:hypothetical protein
MKKTKVLLPKRDLLKQAEILQEVSVDLDPATVDLIQFAITEDMQFWEMLYNEETKNQLLERFLTGEIDLRAGTIEAARILVNLVLGEPL